MATLNDVITKLNETKVAKAGDLMSGSIRYDKVSAGFLWKVDNGDQWQLRTYTPTGALQVIKTRNGKEWGAMNFIGDGGFDITAYNGEDGQTPYVLKGTVDGRLLWRGQNMIFVKESWVSGTSWYRVWSDGFIEQGGQTAGDNVSNLENIISLHIPMSTTNYYCNGNAPSQGNVTVYQYTTTQLRYGVITAGVAWHPNTPIRWEVRGY